MRKEKSKIALILISGICLLGLSLFYSCGFDSGLQMQKPLPIGQFNGKTIGTWPAEYQNPKIAIVWESLTGGISIWNVGSAAIDSSSGHVTFTGSFSHLPSSIVTNPDSQYVIGKMWLYNDANGDGQLNLTLPADYVATQNSILAARQDFQSAMNQFYSVADSSPSRVDKLDTFLITNGSGGSLSFASSPNTPILNHDGSNPTWSPKALLHARDRVQYAPNNWETFFNQDDNFESPNPPIRSFGGDTMLDCHSIRYTPVPGVSLSDFEHLLEIATVKRAWLDSLTTLAKQKIDLVLAQATSSSTSEKIIGRSISDNIVYFPTSADLKMSQAAEKNSPYSLSGKDSVGFNFLECGDERDCTRRDWGKDSISIFLGDNTTPIFGRPFMPKPFVTSATQSPTVSNSLQTSGFSGDYRCQCGDASTDVQASLYGNDFWMAFPNYSYHLFKLTDDSTFFYDTSSYSIQARFIPLDTGVTSLHKLISVIVDRRISPYPETLQYNDSYFASVGAYFVDSVKAHSGSGFPTPKRSGRSGQ